MTLEGSDNVFLHISARNVSKRCVWKQVQDSWTAAAASIICGISYLLGVYSSTTAIVCLLWVEEARSSRCFLSCIGSRVSCKAAGTQQLQRFHQAPLFLFCGCS